MWAIAIPAGLVGLIVLALCVPLDAIFSLDASAKPKLKLRLEWLFGLISREMVREKKKPEEKKKTAEKKRKKKKRPGVGTVLSILRTRGLLRQTGNLVTDVLRQFKIRDITANLKLGLDDPADTGWLFALVGSATPFLNLPSRSQVRVEPLFYSKASFEGYLQAAIRLRPIELAGPMIRFVFSLAVLRVVKTLVSGRWKRKK